MFAPGTPFVPASVWSGFLETWLCEALHDDGMSALGNNSPHNIQAATSPADPGSKLRPDDRNT